ncbi:radical SAM protein [Micromonospora sp. U56]|uniref:radical SAM protein n=1 Tax=Micromonospora sp. U56 TaxID=2824900 RepID=UPI001B37D3DD|nr:radical SAM protein [Micromonospora sp. U56]MBQ0897425.1 radical SAM protein [Micromonospora sp. U56]
MSGGLTLAAKADHAQEFAASFSNDLLHLILLPTEQCNFRCTYCYEDFSIGTMKPAVVNGVKRLIERRMPGLRQLHVAWFGGEPLIALNIVEDVSRFVKELSDRSVEVIYSAEMTTNAYRLDLETASRLCQLGIEQYQITLDGPQHHHDRTRLQRNGEGSFERIWDNLIALRNSDLSYRVCLRVHVTPANLPDMPGFIRLLREKFLEDQRFSILIKAVGRWGGPNDQTMQVLEGPEKTQALNALHEKALPGIKEESIYTPGGVCYASRANSLMIRANGEIGKCTVALSDPANSIGRLLEDGTLQLRNSVLRPWLRGWSSGDSEVLGCPLVGLPRSDGQPALLQIGARPVYGSDVNAVA